MYQAPSFLVETFFIPDIQPMKIFHLVITLCERGEGRRDIRDGGYVK
jgi:hypothetical protein